MIRSALFLLFLFSAVSGVGQTAAAAHPSSTNWQRVQALPGGASIYVRAGKRHQSCRIRTVYADALTCTSGSNPVYSRDEISSIKLAHHGRSTLVAAVAAAAIGAVVGAAVSGTGGSHCQTGQFICLDGFGPSGGQAIGAVSGAASIVAVPIGYFSDFMRSTIYNRNDLRLAHQ